jgi:hypothetical protein
VDRVALALGIVGVLAVGAGVYRGQEAVTTRTRAEAMERRVAAAQRELARVRQMAPDRAPLARAAESLKTFATETAATGTTLSVRVALEATKKPAWAPVSAEGVHVTMESIPSSIAARDWVAFLVDRHPLFLTKLTWDGRAGHVHGAIVGQ